MEWIRIRNDRGKSGCFRANRVRNERHVVGANRTGNDFIRRSRLLGQFAPTFALTFPATVVEEVP
jgi:hypothetical protein